MHNENQSEPLSTTWGRHVRGWQTTEQSQSAYCKAHDLNYHCFIYWRRKLVGATKRKTKPARSSGFVPVQSGPMVVVEDLSLALPNGMTLQGITSTNLPVVQQLLSLLP
jgi:hypothetical protein